MSKRGNTKRQRMKRKERLKNRPEKKDHEYLLIDGNWSRYPEAFCEYHNAYLTRGLMDTHRCDERHCVRCRKVFGR